MATPAVVSVIAEFREDLAARERSQFTAMAAAWKDVEGALEDRMFSLASRIAEDGGVPSQGQLMSMDRYRELLRQLRIETQKYAADLVPTIEGEQLAYGRAGIEQAGAAIVAVGGPEIVGSFNVLPISAVENMVGLAGDGSPLTKILDETWPDGAAAMTQALIRSTALGVNPRVTARQMAKATEASLDRMMVIARTEQLRVFREASRQSYEASGIVKSYRRIAAKQVRTCSACLMADGSFYHTDTIMDSHVQCRCALIPWVDGVANTDWPTGQDWFLKQDAATQKDILGKGRYDAWKAGAFRLEDIPRSVPNDTWGPSLQPRSLAGLLKGETFDRGARPEAARESKPAKVRAPRVAKIVPAPEPVVSKFGDSVRSAVGAGVKTTDDAKRVGRLVATEVEARTPPARNDLIEQLANHNKESADRSRKALAAEAKMNKLQTKLDRLPPAASVGLEGLALRTERDKLKAQLDAATRQQIDDRKTRLAIEARIATIGPDTLRTALAEIRDMGGVRPSFAAGSDTDAMSHIVKAAEFYPKTWLEKSGAAIPILALDVDRGSYRHLDARMGISGYTTKDRLSAAIHEIGHRFESTVPGLRDLEEKFYKQRTGKDPLIPMGGSFRSDEVTRKDKFIHPYMGKDYSGLAYELLTMSFEGVFAGTYDLSQDPEMLEWALGVLAGA